MEFNDHEELVKIKFHKINDLIPFSNQYDCEMTPDFIDGGHGIQVSQSQCQKILRTIFFSGPETVFSSQQILHFIQRSSPIRFEI